VKLDAALGARIERAVIAHHRRRLRRLGKEDVLDAPAEGWAAGPPPPRAGNSLDVFVDGADALPVLAAAIEAAQSSVWLGGWFFSPAFRLEHEGPVLRDLLARTAERADVRVLAWAGAPLPLFHPDRGEARATRDELERGTRVRCALDAKERPFHCHHEKIAVIDGELAFVGGVDLTDYQGNRLDRSDHPPRGAIGWHDAATRFRGPAVADVAEHFRLRWREVTGEELPAPPPQEPAGDVELQVVRTVPEKVYAALPNGDFTILESYVRALRSAERLIYLENQFLWSPEIVAVLAEKLRTAADPRFRLLVLLPVKPNNGKEDTRGQLGVLAEADDGRGRFLACTLSQTGPAAEPVYVHAKVGVVDDRWLTVGSANLNEHSLFNDTEVNVVTRDERIARETRIRLWSEHLQQAADGDPTELVDTVWRPRAAEQLERLRRGEPLTHRLLELPHVSRRSAGILGPINGLLVDG
jgi:phosphatidylserine/phosphatidylglycerophosphate/cardiolipin synthase-like enzyme